jgi:hypothetical protein
VASRDVERNYSVDQFAAKLRRLADALEADRPFRIQVAGERIRVPKGAAISVETSARTTKKRSSFSSNGTSPRGTTTTRRTTARPRSDRTGQSPPGRKAPRPAAGHIVAWLPGARDVPKSCSAQP